MDDARRSKRYPSDQPLAVRCETWREFVELYAGDIGQGGMFIVTEDPPPLLDLIEIRMLLPEATEILLSGRVVHIIEQEEAARTGKRPGIGIEFIDLAPERKRQILQLVEFARWQGSSDPNASFARTLSELSPSIASDKLASAIGDKARSSDRHVAQPAPARGRYAQEDSRKIRIDADEQVAQAQRDPRKAALDGKRKPPPRGTSDPLGNPGLLKVILTNFAHKRYEHALKVTREVLVETPNDPQALKWQSMCLARLALGGGDEKSAVEHYEKALQYDENNREAREYVRTYHRDKRLNALPFGRYFTKKK